MSTEQLIPASDLCSSHHIDITFIQSLHEYGLIEVITVEQTSFVHLEQLPQLEQYIRLHYELDINLPGIDAISNLLQRIESMQGEIKTLKSRLRSYETNE